MLDSLNQIVGFVFDTFDSVIGLYLAGGVLTGFAVSRFSQLLFRL